MVDLRVTARRPVLLTNSASIVVGFAMYAQSLILPQILQLPEETGHGLGQSMIMMGLCMAPGGLMMMAVSPIGGKLSAGHGPKTTLLVGCLIIALGYTAGLLLMGSVLGLAVVAAICRTGVGFAYGAMPALIMGEVPATETASAKSVNSLMRSVGTSSASAVVGVVLAQMSVPFAGHTIPTESGFRVVLLTGAGVELRTAARPETRAQITLVGTEHVDGEPADAADPRPRAPAVIRAEQHEGRFERDRRERLACEAGGPVLVETGHDGDAAREPSHGTSHLFGARQFDPVVGVAGRYPGLHVAHSDSIVEVD